MPAPGARVRERLAQATLDLVRIPSATGNERELAGVLERWALAQPGFGNDDVIRHGNSLIAGQPDGRRPALALVGHLDTVPAHSNDPPAGINATRVVGLGASDMKGGLAVMQVLCEQLDLPALPFAVVLVLYDREEGPYAESGLGPLLETFDLLRDIDLAIVMEPTDNSLQLGCMGSLQAKFIWKGKSAHSARPWEGENAMHKAGPLLARLFMSQPRPVEVEGLLFRESLNATLASGGHARNVIPDRFELNLNYRFAPYGDPQHTSAEAERTVRRLAGDAEVQILDIAPPGAVPADNPMLEHIKQYTGVEVRPKEAWTDVARLAAQGIDALNFGPGAGSQAHQAGEWIAIDELVRSYDMLVKVLSTPLAN